MMLAHNIEQALRAVLPEAYHASIPALAQVLAAALDGQEIPAITPDLLEAMRQLQGQSLNLTSGTITVQNVSGEGIAIGHGATSITIPMTGDSINAQGSQGFVNRLAGDVYQHFHNYGSVIAPQDERERRNRVRILQKVHRFWVQGLLEKSLHRMALMELEMKYQPDAIAYPWEMVIERPESASYLLPQSVHIARVFDDLHGELLILGAPGAGKTTMLLELARLLIVRAHQEETYPIPVVFNLSSWTAKRASLAEWLVDELNMRYDVPHKVGNDWIAHDQMLPLLDGLDEVRPEEHRIACVEAINAFRQEHGLVGMVVCSREAEYAALRTRLRLGGAIVIQPLTDTQIDTYLEQHNERLTTLRTLLCEDDRMRKLATIPLMLSIMTLAYGTGTGEIKQKVCDRSTNPRRQLFDAYVYRMFRRRGGCDDYTREQTIRWLSWLAGQMMEHGQTEFSGYFVKDVINSYLIRTFIGANHGIAGTLLTNSYLFMMRSSYTIQGFFPWNYDHFLDYATERIFLRKVGGGYIFIHRMLMEYFAGLTPEEQQALVEWMERTRR